MGRLYLPPQVLVAVALLAAIGTMLTLLAQRAGAEPRARDGGPRAAHIPEVVPRVVSVTAPAEEPPARAASSRPAPGALVVRPERETALVVRARPHGPVVARLGARTEFGSPTTLLVAERRGRWYGVVTTHVRNGRLGWVDARRSHLREARTRVRLTLDLSARRLVVHRGGRVLRRLRVGIGRPSSPTPVGRFAVTDKLAGARFGPYYGCCILALSAHQPDLPPGWRGGDRIAIHGTDDPSSVGAAVSAGCPRARAVDLRYLVRTVPLGAPVVVRR